MISIITSLYKSDKYLAAFAKNLVAFSERLMASQIAFEVIVIANNPTAAELAFMKRFSGEDWFRSVAVKREPLYATWNRGVELSRGDIIVFWNVDDIRRADAIIDGARLIDAGANLVNFPFRIKWYLNIFNFSVPVKSKLITPPEYEKSEFTRSMHCGPFFMFRKSLYYLVGPFDEQFKIVGDFDWCIRAAKATDKFALSKKSAGVFRVDGNGLSAGGTPLHVAENNAVYQRHGVRDKIISADDDGSPVKYDTEHIFFQGKYINIK